MEFQIQYKEYGGKRWFNFSHRKLNNLTEAKKMLSVAKRTWRFRTFRLVRRKKK